MSHFSNCLDDIYQIQHHIWSIVKHTTQYEVQSPQWHNHQAFCCFELFAKSYIDQGCVIHFTLPAFGCFYFVFVLQSYKANSSETEAPFLDLNLSITKGIVSSKIYDKWDDFNFEIVNSHFLMEMFLALLPMVYIFLSLFVLLECGLMLMTSTTETYF